MQNVTSDLLNSLSASCLKDDIQELSLQLAQCEVVHMIVMDAIKRGAKGSPIEICHGLFLMAFKLGYQLGITEKLEDSVGCLKL